MGKFAPHFHVCKAKMLSASNSGGFDPLTRGLCSQTPVIGWRFTLVSDIAIFVLKKDVKLQLTNSRSRLAMSRHFTKKFTPMVV